ncbi:hypothetical protein BHE74_00021413 [Ensete ventricosum]|nr:hypothetical protein BHE74_00021413 [Ensete ventricosum]RZS16200.1 hypothetical protein BHM03_00048164 [Ensete ventricosum]
METAMKYDDMVSNRHREDLRYGRLVAFTIKAPAPLRREGDQKEDSRTNLTVEEVMLGTTPDSIFLQEPPLDPSSTTSATDLPSRTQGLPPSNEAPPLR